MGAAVAASNIAPNAVNAVSLDDDRKVHLDSMLIAAAFDGLRASRVVVGFSNARGVGMCVGVVNGDAIPGVVDAGSAVAEHLFLI